jgi:hypothetical protein
VRVVNRRAEGLLGFFDKTLGLQGAKGRVDKAVFVGVGERGENTERMAGRFIPGVVWLNPLDESSMLGV